MKQYLLLITIALSIIVSSCAPEGFTIKGSIPDAQNLSVYFDKVNPITSTNSVVAKSQTNGNGQFSLILEESPAGGAYRVRIGAKSIYLVLSGSEQTIEINGSLQDVTYFNHSITGSPLSEDYTSKIRNSINGTTPVADLATYLSSQADPMVAMMIGAQRFGDISFSPLHQSISQRLQASYPNEQITKDYSTFAASVQREYARQQSLAKVKIGQPAPDIILPDLNGKERKLSDLKGQVVLLDFWASWCGPCRRENPNVVRIYDKYNKDGFTVYSVSLDGLDSRTKRRFPEDQIDNQMRIQKQRWVSAIEKDNLKWESHVSDLKKWESAAAALYGVTSIPRTFLLDRDGKIAAINPRRNLEQAVQTLL